MYEARVRRSTAFSNQAPKWLEIWAITFLGSLISFFSLLPLQHFLPYSVSDCLSTVLIHARSLYGLICQDCSDWEVVEARYTVKDCWLTDDCTWSVYHNLLPQLLVFIANEKYKLSNINRLCFGSYKHWKSIKMPQTLTKKRMSAIWVSDICADVVKPT